MMSICCSQGSKLQAGWIQIKRQRITKDGRLVILDYQKAVQDAPRENCSQKK